VVTDLEVRGLLDKTATYGSAVRPIIEAVKGQRVGIVFTIQTVTTLLMTLSAMASSALCKPGGDPSTRVTYPLNQFHVELSPGGALASTG
jgi:hypothetical protein